MPHRRALPTQTAKTTAFLQKSLTTPRRFAILYSVAERQQTRGGVAHLGERLNGIQEVRGSIPLISTTNLQQKSVPIGHGLLFVMGILARARLQNRRPLCLHTGAAAKAHGCPRLCRGDGQPSPRMRRKLPSEARAGNFRMVMAHCIYRRLNGPTVAIKKCMFCCIKRACPYGTSRVRPLKGAVWAARFPNRYDKKTGRAHFPGRFCSF